MGVFTEAAVAVELIHRTPSAVRVAVTVIPHDLRIRQDVSPEDGVVAVQQELRPIPLLNQRCRIIDHDLPRAIMPFQQNQPFDAIRLGEAGSGIAPLRELHRLDDACLAECICDQCFITAGCQRRSADQHEDQRNKAKNGFLHRNCPSFCCRSSQHTFHY